MTLGRIGRCVIIVAAALGSDHAAACPVCDGPTGRQIREELFGRDLGLDLLATTLPFAAVAGVVAVVHFGWPVGRRRDGNTRR